MDFKVCQSNHFRILRNKIKNMEVKDSEKLLKANYRSKGKEKIRF